MGAPKKGALMMNRVLDGRVEMKQFRWNGE